MSYILHIDTSADKGIIALSKDGILLDTRLHDQPRDHAAFINLMIEDLLQQTGISLQELSAVCICHGPGSYTGLRIGMATAKGLCYALGKPLIAHNKLTLLALQQHALRENRHPVLSLLPAREGEYFMALYTYPETAIIAPCHAEQATLYTIIQEHADDHCIVAGKAEEDLQQFLAEQKTAYVPSPEIDLTFWAAHAFNKFLTKNFSEIANIIPDYLKNTFIYKRK